MIPTLLFLLLRRYRQRHPDKAERVFSMLRVVLRIALLLLLTAGIALFAFSQERVLQYAIKRSGNPVGAMTIKEIKSGNRVSLELQSFIKTSFLFTIQVKALEEAVYENGTLTFARFYQKVNSNERVNTQMQATSTAYKVVAKDETTLLKHYPITYNMVCLYTMEPLRVRQVFLDKYQQFVPVNMLGPHHYKITFPDGAANDYYYQDGICVNIHVNSTWFSAEMELKK